MRVSAAVRGGGVHSVSDISELTKGRYDSDLCTIEHDKEHSGGPSVTPTFTGSSSSSDALQLQRALNKTGGSSLPKLIEDGVSGPKTNARTIEFQRSRGLTPDGIAGPKTRAALGLSGTPAGAAAPAAFGVASVTPVRVVNAVISAAKLAFGSWKQAAQFRGIIINSVTAVGPPGCLVGPDFLALMSAQFASLQGDDQALAQAAATGISTNFAIWQNGITVPGLPWYPAFAAVPGPVAPPTPNLPTPLLALPSAGAPGIMSVPLLKSAMELAAGPALRARSASIFGDIAIQVAPFFQVAIAGTLVRGVLGTGPVPSFAPPFAIVGPVVGGSVIPTPGQLL